jgi:multidrug efflux system membrane fusion protein
MHGELPKQIWAKASERKRRTFVIGLIVIVSAAALIYFFTGSSDQRAGRGRFQPDATVPVLVAPAAKADVPVYLDAVGTTKALNTVTVSPQVDGK